MATQEIQQQELPAFLNRFSQQHEGWLVTLEVLDPQIGAQEQVHDLPLEGITADFKGHKTASIVISVGDSPENHVTHTITDPAHVYLEQTSSGANAALEIESGDGAKTLLRFRSALLPEMVDGMVSG